MLLFANLLIQKPANIHLRCVCFSSERSQPNTAEEQASSSDREQVRELHHSHTGTSDRPACSTRAQAHVAGGAGTYPPEAHNQDGGRRTSSGPSVWLQPQTTRNASMSAQDIVPRVQVGQVIHEQTTFAI